MNSENFFLDNEDLNFQFDKRIPFKDMFAWLSEEEKEAVVAKTPEEYKKNWLEVVETFGDIAADIGTRAAQMEKEPISLENGEVVLPPSVQQNLGILQEFGVAGFSIHPKYGGMGAPFIFDMIGCELLNRACPSTMLNAAWYGPIAHVIEQFGSEAMRDEYIPRIATGELDGNMALTEPDAGSDLGSIRTYAERQKDGSYKIYGTKRFISNGNGQLSLVLARTSKESTGLKGLSLFLCPRKIDGSHNYKIVSIEEKVALHGSATCELAYDGSKAFVIGKENSGYSYMLKLMNESRIGVGFQGIGLLEGSYREAKQYAESRSAWGKTLDQHEMIMEYLLDLDVELRAMRSLGFQLAYVRSMEILGTHYAKRCKPRERRSVLNRINDYQYMGRKMTPLLKYWVAERSFANTRTGYQIFGGYGFTKEYRAEWYLRESLIYSVYEGTSQIQALMCVKDTMKDIIQRPKLFVQNLLGDSYRSMIERNPLQRRLFQLKNTSNRATLDMMIKLIKVNMKISISDTSKSDLFKMAKIIKEELMKFEDLRPALLHAERLTAIKALEAQLEAVTGDARSHITRNWIAERFGYKANLEAKFLREAMQHDEPVLWGKMDKVQEKFIAKNSSQTQTNAQASQSM